MTGTPERLLRLLSLLQTRREWTGAELSGRLGVSPRTVRRDVDRLRELGYPVRATRGMVGGYRLEAGAAMPPLLLDDEEAVAIAVGLRLAAGGGVTGIEEASVRALAKLTRVLPSRLRSRVAALHTTTAALYGVPGDGAPPVDTGTLTLLAAAAHDGERVRFAYVRPGGARTRRLVEPCGLVAWRHRWYLLAWDTDRGAWRVFRADRMAEPLATGVRFAPRDPPPGGAAEFVGRTIATQPHRYRAVVTVHAPYDQVLPRVVPSEEELEPAGDAACVLRTDGDELPRLAARVLALDLPFTVTGPPELRDHLRALRDRVDASLG
jgi:predicted DNA-binding transcriptional regulator YafY